MCDAYGLTRTVVSRVWVSAGDPSGLPGTAQRLGCTASSGGGQDQSHGGGHVDPPAGMYDERAGTRSSAHPARDDLIADAERADRPAAVPRPRALGNKGPMCDADRGEVEHGTQVDRQPGSSRVVATGGVEEQNVGRRLEQAHRPLHQGTHAEGQQPWLVRRPRNALDHMRLGDRASAHNHCGGPGRIADIAGPSHATREAHPAAPDEPALSGDPSLRRGQRQVLLRDHERVGVLRPHVSIVTCLSCAD
jgi:hypothetical protein